MNTGRIEVICGSDGSGKTAMAFGKALYALSQQKQVIVIQFLKGCGKRQDSPDIFKRLEPELKVFRFEKSDHYYESLTPDEKKEECYNIKNGLNYARKVLTTGECDLLILDDLGTEFPSAYVNAALYNIINSRMLAERPTIISTNLTLKELESRYSERFASRIAGYYGKLEFLGNDVRVQKRLQKSRKHP